MPSRATKHEEEKLREQQCEELHYDFSAFVLYDVVQALRKLRCGNID